MECDRGTFCQQKVYERVTSPFKTVWYIKGCVVGPRGGAPPYKTLLSIRPPPPPPPRCVPFLTQATFPALADDMEEAIPCVTCNFFLSCHISISCNIRTLVNLLARAHIISCSILIARVCLIFTGIFSFFPSFFFFFLFFFSFCFCEDSAPPLQEILQWRKEQD